MSDISSVGFSNARAAAGGGGANVDTMVRNQRRLGLLQTYADEFVTSSPSSAIALAESTADDDEILRSATEAVGFANITRIHKDLTAESTEVQRTVHANLPRQVQDALSQLGYTAPDPDADEGGGGRLFGSIPGVGSVVKRALDWGEVPGIGGALEEAQHFVGEGLEPVGRGLNTALAAASYPAEQVQHFTRAMVYGADQGQIQNAGLSAALGPIATIATGDWSPSEIGRAWNATDEDDGYVRPDNEQAARRLLDRNDEAYELAHATAMHKPIEDIIAEHGFEPGSVEATSLVQRYQALQGTQEFREAVNKVSTGFVSFGRVMAQEGFGLEDTDAGLGRYVSGLGDAGFSIFADPLLVVGKASSAARFGRNAFRMESVAGRATAARHSDLALAALRAREGSQVGQLHSGLTRLTRTDMRLGRRILGWSDRVAEGFATNDFANLMRDLPDVSTGLGHLSDYHLAQKAQGLRGLDDSLGVVEYLQSRDSLLGLMGSRIGGASPKTWGYRMPTLTRFERATASTKEFWQKTVDWSRFAGSTPDRIYGPYLAEVIQAAGNPRNFARQSGRWLASKTVGSFGRTMSLLTSHTPYRDVLHLSGPDAIPEFSRLINTGLFGGMNRQQMDQYINAFTLGDEAVRAKIEEQFLEELFRRGGVHDTDFAKRFIGRHREAYALDEEAGSMRLVDVGSADVVAIPDVRSFLTQGVPKVTSMRTLFHGSVPSAADAALAKFWKPAVLLRLGFIARAAGEEMLHSLLKNGPRVHLGSMGATWMAKNDLAKDIRVKLATAETAGHADDVNRLRHSLADVEGSMFLAPVRSLMSGVDRMGTQLFASTKSSASPLRRRLAEKAERFDMNNPQRTYTGLERWGDDIALWSSGIMGRLGRATPGDMTKAKLGELMANRWNPAAAEGARHLLRHPATQRYFAEHISGATMTPWEYRSIEDVSGVPIERVTWGEMRGGVPITEEIAMRPMPGEAALDRVLDDPTFYRSLHTRHTYTRTDRVERAIVDNVLPRYVGPWRDDALSAMGYDDIGRMRDELNRAWSHQWSDVGRQRLESLDPAERAQAGFDSGEDALGFLRRYIDGDVDPELPTGWVGSRLKDLFQDAGLGLSAGKLLRFLDDPLAPAAAKRWLLYRTVDPGRLIDNDVERLRRTMQYAARGRLARPDMYEALRKSRLYAKGENLARPVQRGISKVYVPLMPPTYTGGDLTDDFIEAAEARIMRIGGIAPEQAATMARNAAAASVNPGLAEASSRIGMVPLGAWGSSDPRITEAVMAAAEDVTGLKPTFGILEVPDEVVKRSTDPVLAQGLSRAEGAVDYHVDSWRLLHTRPTTQERRYHKVTVGDEDWDDGALRQAEDTFGANPAPGTIRVYSADRAQWSPSAPDGPFWFSDVPEAEAVGETARAQLDAMRIDDLRGLARQLQIPRYSRLKKGELIDILEGRPEMRTVLARTGAGPIPDDVIEAAGAHRLPGLPGTWDREAEEISDGLGEITALERAADRTVNEVVDILTTFGRADAEDDVLHEVVEPLMRGDRYVLDEATNVEEFRPGYSFDHLMKTSGDRLPTNSYGPRMFAGRNLAWSNFVREWFDGPVNRAISSLVRSPMFVNTFGDQLRSVKAMADLLTEPAARDAALGWADNVGVAADDLDELVMSVVDDFEFAGKTRFVPDAEMRSIVNDYSQATEELGDFDLEDLKRYATQRHHGLNLARDNALNRTVQLTIPYIDDHRIRSAFQSYVGNFIPFMFAEEQFLKRWGRSVIESPEMIRKAQLAMNGLRSMGTVRRDDQGREIFVYPLVGDVAEVLAKPLEWVTGKKISLPYEIAMTGDVGYTLPGFGDQMGQPSMGPLVGMGVEFLSRMYPELSEVEEVVIGRGANRPVWQYIIPSGAAKIWEAGWGDIDSGALASAQTQAIQTMAANGQLPPETATPEERQEFMDRAESQARYILMVRGMFGLTAPAAPQVQFEGDELTDEFRALLQADIPFEEAIQLFLANHPDDNPAELLAATVSTTETEFGGLDMPTDEAFDWTTRHQDLVEAYPAAAAWLTPRAESDDPFSQRAYNQQLAMGLRKRKSAKEFIDDIYFRTASQDYFDARGRVEEQTATLTGGNRQAAMEEWRVWKDAYFAQHPLFAVMLQDPVRQQKRDQAINQLIALSGRDDDLVPAELKEMMHRFEEFQLTIEALRGDRRQAVANQRGSIVGETATWMQWHIARYPHLSGPYLRLLEPKLREADEDAVLEVIE